MKQGILTCYLFREHHCCKSSHHEFLHTDGKSGRVKQNLTIPWHEADYIFNQNHKVLGKQLVCLSKEIFKEKVIYKT